MKTALFLFMILISIGSCKDRDKCPYTFELPAQIIPLQREYRIGDTITFLSKFHEQVLAYNIEKNEVGTYNMEGIKWSPATSIFRIDTISDDKSVVHKDFSFLPDSNYNYNLFVSSSNFGAIDGEYNFEKDTFYLQARLIAKKKGTFFFMQDSGSGLSGGDRQDFPGKCRGVHFDVRVKMNDGGNNNIGLLSESPNETYNTWMLQKPDDRFHRVGGFCFKIVE